MPQANSSLPGICRERSDKNITVLPFPYLTIVLRWYQSCGKNEKQCGQSVKCHKTMRMCSFQSSVETGQHQILSSGILNSRKETLGIKSWYVSVHWQQRNAYFSTEFLGVWGEMQQWNIPTILEWKLEKRMYLVSRKGRRDIWKKLQPWDFSVCESREEQGEQDRAAVKGRDPCRPNHPPESGIREAGRVAKSKRFCKE